MKAESERRLREVEKENAQDKLDWQAFERICVKYRLCVVTAPDPDEKVPVVVPSTYEQARNEAEIVIRIAGRPVPNKQLWQAVANRGVKFPNSKNPESALAGYLVKYKKLQYLQGIGWWINGVPWPPTPNMLHSLQVPPQPAAASPPNETDTNGHEYVTRHHRPHGRRPSPFTQKVLAFSAELLNGKTEPTRTADIFRQLIEAGVEIPNDLDEPQNRVAAILGKSKQFRSHGRAGWTLEGAPP